MADCVLTTGQLLTTGHFFDHWSNVWDPPKVSGEKLFRLLVKRSCWSNLISGQFFWLLVKKPATPRKCLGRNYFDCWSNAVAGQIWLVVKFFDYWSKKIADPPKVSGEKLFRLMVKRSCWSKSFLKGRDVYYILYIIYIYYLFCVAINSVTI